MNILLDTHIVLWWYEDPQLLHEDAKQIMEDKNNQLFLSAAVIWEMTIKTSLGKLKIPKGFIEKASADFIELPISIRHVQRLLELDNIHNDPFDRILISQALEENFYLVTRDKNILRYKLDLIKA